MAADGGRGIREEDDEEVSFSSLTFRAMDLKDRFSGKSVLYNPAAIARRKRMEIRRFKKLSYSMGVLPIDPNPVEICHHLKRSHPSLDEPYESWEDSEDMGIRSPKLQKEEGNGFSQTKNKDISEQSGLSHPKLQEEQASVYVKSKVKEIVESAEQSGYSVILDIGEASEQLTHESPDFDLQKPRSARWEDVLWSPAMSGEIWFQCNKDIEVSAITGGASSSVQSKAWTSYGSSHRGCPPSGKLLICGAKRKMEDRVAIVPSFAQLRCDPARMSLSKGKIEGNSICFLHFYAVYDGHGSSQTSQYCMERLHFVLAEELSNFCEVKNASKEFIPCHWKNVMSSCFLRMDKELGGFCPNKQLDDVGSSATCSGSIPCESVGMTAVVAVVSSVQIVVASCGDSKVVLSRGGKAFPLSFDHKLEREDKSDCMEAACEEARSLDGQRNRRIPAGPKAVGDQYSKHFVVSEPKVTCIQRSEEDECLVLASNGLWDVISNDTACEIARKCLDSSRRMRESVTYESSEDPASVSAAALLVKVAFSRGSKDNISVVVVDLKS